MSEAIFHGGVLASSSIFLMSTSERCFHFSCMGRTFSIAEQSRNDMHDMKVTGVIILILIHFMCQILYILINSSLN